LGFGIPDVGLRGLLFQDWSIQVTNNISVLLVLNTLLLKQQHLTEHNIRVSEKHAFFSIFHQLRKYGWSKGEILKYWVVKRSLGIVIADVTLWQSVAVWSGSM
jgi:uncharacterized ubiquitin-like protein YukD